MDYIPWMDILEGLPVKNQEMSCAADPNNIHEKIKEGFLIPLTALIILINVAILIVMKNDTKFHTKMYAFVATLGIADFAVGLVSIGTLITKAKESTLDLCLVRIGFTISTCVASILCLMCIAIERYIAITYSLRYKLIVTRCRVATAILFVWVVSFSIGFAPLAGWRVQSYGDYCSFLYVLPDDYILFMFSTSAAVPIAVMFGIYVKLYRHARYHIKRIEAIESISSDRKGSNSILGMSSRSWKSLKTLLAVFGCVLLTWIPFLLTTIIHIVCDTNTCYLKDIIGTYLLVLGFSNSFLNPMIYVIRTKDFQEKVKEKIQRRRQSSFCNIQGRFQTTPNL